MIFNYLNAKYFMTVGRNNRELPTQNSLRFFFLVILNLFSQKMFYSQTKVHSFSEVNFLIFSLTDTN